MLTFLITFTIIVIHSWRYQMKDNNNYEDVTKEWLNKATPNSHKILNRLFYEEKKCLLCG